MTEKKELTVIEDKPSQVTALISQGLASGASVEAMKGLYEIYQKERDDQRRMLFNEAMAKFQAECPIIKKATPVIVENKTVYNYAKIEAIISQVKKFIESNGFSYQVKTGKNGANLFATCIVKHVAGWSEETTFEVPVGTGTRLMSAPQVAAASLTFAKRYAFCNAFGIMTGDDDTNGVKPGMLESDAEPTQFEAAVKVLNGIKTATGLATFRERVKDHAELTNQEKIKLYGLIDTRKASFGTGK